MLIANPIYDVVFKRLLDNNRVARFLVGTILGCKVISLEQSAQEHSKLGIGGILTLYRMDFAATIETEDGSKRVLIEVQKAKSDGDVYRFREYLGGEYTKSELPVIAIYILGFNLSVDAPAFAAYPEYEDLRTREKLDIRDGFVERLTHKAYFIQAKRIKQSVSTTLDALLSIFGQENFISADETVKDFPAEANSPDMQEVLDVLHYAAVDAKARKELDDEIYYQNYVEHTFGKKDREIAEALEQLEKKDKTIEEKDKKLEEFQRKTVRLMKSAGASTKKISEETGITPEEVERLLEAVGGRPR